MIEDLEKTTRNAIIWNALDKVSNQVISIVIGIILARILNSSDYGLIGMLAIFIAIANSCIDSGFSSALVRKQNPTEADYNTVFYSGSQHSFFFRSTHPCSTLPKSFLHILNKRFRTYPNSTSRKRNTIQKSNNYQPLISLYIRPDSPLLCTP